jgi:hypothetical protein
MKCVFCGKVKEECATYVEIVDGELSYYDVCSEECLKKVLEKKDEINTNQTK